MEDRQSFITEARREQIIKAAVEVLREVGYVSTSLSKIAKKANISTGLISYHFSGKEDLMNNTLMYLVEQEWLFINARVSQKQASTEKLKAFIEASLAYQVINRTNNIALIEIVFNARTPDHIPYYLLEDDEEDLIKGLLQEILLQGQESKEFGDFNIQVTATIIQGSISESLISNQSKMSLENYSEELIKSILKIVK
ncbi:MULTISPECIES: TetR/AcrR family transcriptional regulator [Bacillus]|uniref:TetR/AcrR family transcriptional regulator n=1 Tax=Bacillus TaxID=1386 RepID=UPI0001A18C3B|nr:MULTISPECIES: TetR/AcrR family transcriptional regulator [Bacillus]EEM13425.1 TetR/AcrR family transcriptional regulator [Bacillus pseudomycoides DSM 12442]MED1598685.1 TetR/AcrR family transcriptional regulator [Bacillus pseudomycoides]OOR48499.1 TetR family transcriptional regulator [Bacillus pseudomycoides]PDY09271.1 TetR/AcrR family transcriptional regulator [Bacillus pseudomycoides]PEU28000.1 TetR/AcrR family transcriptional regulator [Bacillus pseudomycoides]